VHRAKAVSHGFGPKFSSNNFEFSRNFVQGLIPAYGLPFATAPWADAFHRFMNAPGGVMNFKRAVALRANEALGPRMLTIAY
jgi:hypothetical protein